jgi:hypothetical protein
MYFAGALSANLTLNSKGFTSGIREAKASVEGFKSHLAGITSSLRAAAKEFRLVGAAATAGLGTMVRHAMNIEEAETLFEVSFGNMAAEVREWSESVSSSLIMTAAEIREGAGVFAVMTQSMGLSESAATSLSKNMTILAADMAGFYNIGHAEALQKLQAGLTGQVEPLRRLGILVNETTVAEWAWANGVAAVGEQLTEQQKVVARYGTIMEQTKMAQGDLMRTTDSTTNQLRRLKVQFLEISEKLGDMLLPYINLGARLINNIVKGIRSWFLENEKLAGGLFVAGAGAVSLFTGLTAVGMVVGPLTRSVTLLGNAFGIAWGKSVAGALPLVGAIAAVAVSTYTLRAVWKQNVEGLKDEWDRLTDHVARDFWLDVIKDAITEFCKWVVWKISQTVTLIGESVMGPAAFITQLLTDPMDFEKAVEAMRKQYTITWEELLRGDPYPDPQKGTDLDFTFGKLFMPGLGGANNAPNTPENEVSLLGEIIGAVVEQFKEDWAGAFDWFKGEFPELASTVESLFSEGPQGDGYEYERIDVEALLAGLRSSAEEGMAAAAGATAGTGRSYEDIIRAAEQLKQSLDPVRAAYKGILEDIETLNDAGSYTEEWQSKLADKWAEQLHDMDWSDVGEAMEQIGAKNASLADEVMTRIQMIKQEAKGLAADNLIARMQPENVQIFEEMRANIELLKAAGRLDDETTNLLSAYSWEEMRVLSTEALDELIGMLYSAGGAYAEAAARIEELRANQAGLSVELANTAGALMDLGFKINQVADTIDSGIGRKIGAVVTSIAGISLGIREAVTAFKTLASSGKASIASTIASVAQLATGVLGAIGAVLTLAEAFGLVGDKAEEVKTGWAKVMDELGDRLDEWADRLTDTIIEFVKTGEFELNKFLQGVAEDILRTTITTMFTQPLMGFIGGAFAKGAAFSGGEVVPFAKGGIATGPAYFPLRGGKTGLLGEAGPEAIMPLRRTDDGSLGVRATVAATTINVIDQRGAGSPPVDVQRRKTADGGEEVRIMIRDAVADTLARGELDGLLGLTFGLQRGRA